MLSSVALLMLTLPHQHNPVETIRFYWNQYNSHFIQYNPYYVSGVILYILTHWSTGTFKWTHLIHVEGWGCWTADTWINAEVLRVFVVSPDHVQLEVIWPPVEGSLQEFRRSSGSVRSFMFIKKSITCFLCVCYCVFSPCLYMMCAGCTIQMRWWICQACLLNPSTVSGQDIWRLVLGNFCIIGELQVFCVCFKTSVTFCKLFYTAQVALCCYRIHVWMCFVVLKGRYIQFTAAAQVYFEPLCLYLCLHLL